MLFRSLFYFAAPVALATALTLGSCQTTQGPENYADDVSPEGKLFGEYLAGTYANYLDDADARSDYYSRAFSRVPTDTNLGRRAVTSALTAGDLKQAYKLSEQMRSSEDYDPMADAIYGAQAMSNGQYGKALNAFENETVDLTVSILMKIMTGWAEYGQGDIDAARTTFKNLPGGSYFARLGLLQTAELEISQGNYDAAMEALDELKARDAKTLDLDMHLTKARLLSAKGDLMAAKEMLAAYKIENKLPETGAVHAAILSLEAGQPLEQITDAKAFAARGLTLPAYGFFAQNRALDAAEVFLRVALSLDKDYAKGKLWLGDILTAFKRHDEAVEFYQQVPTTSPHYVSARLSEGYMYVREDEDEKALAVFEDVNRTHPSYVTRDALGRSHLADENYEAALPIYEALVASLTDAEIKEDPQVLYLRGICYERAKRWEEAVADFQRVLEIRPDDSDALNYLGYTWVDRGENLNKAFDMIRRAVELEPNSGAIVDSLGWAHYKLGQYEKAKVNLEKAVVLSPSSATIIDHLGDVYWKLGRRVEARYQWRKSLDFDPTDKERKDTEQKLKGGLLAVQAAP